MKMARWWARTGWWWVVVVTTSVGETADALALPDRAAARGVVPGGGLIGLSTPVDELAKWVGGTGRAKSVWETLRQGVDPLSEEGRSLLTPRTVEALERACGDRFVPAYAEKAVKAADGTTKVLARLEDGLGVEAVLIPHATLARTTLCVSTQVGCDRGCSFCATGTLGLSRNLTASEICAQFVLALPHEDPVKPLRNVVFMGMGDAGVNCEASAIAAETLTDDARFGLAKSKVTISTVGPSPEAFRTLADAPCMLAWSVHSPDDDLRRQLVKTHHKYTAVQLRAGLVDALLSRKALRARTLMVAATLIAGVNDSPDDARRLAVFVGPLVDACAKLNVDLIPVNPVQHAPHFRRPSPQRLQDFVQAVRAAEPRVHVAVRVTRGDDQNAACGQLIVRDSHSRIARQRQQQRHPHHAPLG